MEAGGEINICGQGATTPNKHFYKLKQCSAVVHWRVGLRCLMFGA